MHHARTRQHVLRLQVENAELRQQVELFKRLAYVDPLTRLGNRRFARRRLQEEVERARRWNEPLSLLYCDIDGFKRINDRFGHRAGDAVLCRVAAVLVRALRKTDVCCRVGGDEFVVILRNADASAAVTLTARLREALLGSMIDGGHRSDEPTSISAEISVGYATIGQGETIDQILARADRGMYREKERKTTSAPPIVSAGSSLVRRMRVS